MTIANLTLLLRRPVQLSSLFASASFSTTARYLASKDGPKICIVGSGPAALYTAQYALKNLDPTKIDPPTIDIFEKLPVPFGLVRYGVAPDHQDVKKVINSFTETMKKPNVNFFGNVAIGTDVQIKDLLSAYNCVVLAYGSHSENYLNVPGEKKFDNFVSAKDLVSLYNGLPLSNANIKIDLRGKHAVVIGAGNVAIDIARILLSPLEKLATTDMSDEILDLFKRERKVEEVTIVARRGLLNAAFTLKELRELTKIEGIQCNIDAAQFDDIHYEKILKKLSRPRKRLTEYMHRLAVATEPENAANKKRINFVFLKTPTEIVGNSETSKVEGVKFKSTRYDVDFSDESLALDSEKALNALKHVDVDVDVEATQSESGNEEFMEADLVIRSIGYKNVSIDQAIPFDKQAGVVPNDQGKVISEGGDGDGLYCTGWIKRGPRGVIVDTTTDAYETAQRMCSDLQKGNDNSIVKGGTEEISRLLRERGVRVVDKAGWNRIDEEEIRRGKLAGKPREKFQSVEDMLEAALINERD